MANLGLMVLSAKARCFAAGTPIVLGILPPDEPVPDEAEQELLGITTLDVIAGAAIAGAIIIARRRKDEEDDLLDEIDSTFEDFDPDCLNEPDREETPATGTEHTTLAFKESNDMTLDDSQSIALNQPVSYKPDSSEIIEPADMPHKEKQQQPKRKTAKRSWAATLSLFGCLLVALVAGSPRWTPLLDGREAEATISALPPTASSSATQSRLVTKPIEDIRCGDRIPSELPGGLVPDDEPEPDPATWRLVELELTKPNGDLVEVKLLRPLTWLQQAGAINLGTFPLNVEELDIEGEAAVLKVLPCPPIQRGEGQVVTATFRHTCDDFVHLHIAGESSPITCTTGHPIWSEHRQEFIPASNLQPNETVRLTSGTLSQVSLVKFESGSRDVFNFEVNRTHVYHVGTRGLLAHNAQGNPWITSCATPSGKISNSNSRNYWKKVAKINGNKVFQRDDLFDPQAISSWKEKGVKITGTNLERMKTGRAPVGLDGKPVNIHHMIQTQDGALAEVSGSFHQKFYSAIHINTGKTPSGIDRSLFNIWRQNYWMERVNDFLE